MSTSRVAAFDCGTNSLRLLVADVEPESRRVHDVVRDMRIVRLGQGVDATGRIDPAALARTMEALREFAAVVRECAVERVEMVATSATRDASNRDEFVKGVREVLGVEPRVLGGDEEAALSFAGATGSLPRRFAPPYLVVDIGGGSTEFVLGDGAVRAALSVDIGCVRLTERWLRSDPPTQAEVAGAVRDIRAELGRVRAAVPVGQARTWVGLAGSVTTVAALALRLPAYDPERIHHAVLTRSQVAEVTRGLLRASRAERAALPVMHPGRVDVIGAGALVLDTICAEFGVAEVVASEHDILDGLALGLATGRPG